MEELLKETEKELFNPSWRLVFTVQEMVRGFTLEADSAYPNVPKTMQPLINDFCACVLTAHRFLTKDKKDKSFSRLASSERVDVFASDIVDCIRRCKVEIDRDVSPELMHAVVSSYYVNAQNQIKYYQKELGDYENVARKGKREYQYDGTMWDTRMREYGEFLRSLNRDAADVMRIVNEGYVMIHPQDLEDLESLVKKTREEMQPFMTKPEKPKLRWF